ncbi:MAG: hypothetical protein ABSC94_26695 [Polyangiaceae bacterium]|jgi:hypothetical protein
MKRAVLWMGVGAGAFASAVLANGCVIVDSCEGHGVCPTEAAGIGADAAGDAGETDACADDGFCGTPGDAWNVDVAVDALVSDGAADSPDEGCLIEDGYGALDSATDSEAGSDGATSGSGGDDGAPVTADIANANAAAPFVGTWTFVGTETTVCPGSSSMTNPAGATMTLTAGPGASDGGEIDLFFDAGADCALAMVVSGGVAELVFAPQSCSDEGASFRVFTSVQVGPITESAEITETFSDATGCEHQLEGELSR